MNTLTDLTIGEALVKLKRREISPVELTQAYIESMESNKKYNAYITTAGEQALEKAKAAEAKYADGSNRKLEGIPLGIKDLFCTKDLRTTACSHILENFIPPYESTVTQNLLDDGALFLGKRIWTNLQWEEVTKQVISDRQLTRGAKKSRLLPEVLPAVRPPP